MLLYLHTKVRDQPELHSWLQVLLQLLQCFFVQNLFDDMYYTNLYGPVLPVKPNNFKNNSVY